jgi:hypothetical protein
MFRARRQLETKRSIAAQESTGYHQRQVLSHWVGAKALSGRAVFPTASGWEDEFASHLRGLALGRKPRASGRRVQVSVPSNVRACVQTLLPPTATAAKHASHAVDDAFISALSESTGRSSERICDLGIWGRPHSNADSGQRHPGRQDPGVGFGIIRVST